ncbi:hypothetical protein ACHHV8_27465 [Paenibacillus sp. TAB 01]|uniref:hypothetical protein n=1 Tax=Paenibacillus sp. TAB 01 TaxID=3368988 RepID=UPI0037538C6D
MKHILYFTRQMHAYAGKILYVNLLGMVLISFLDGLGLFLIVPLLSISGIWNMNAGILSRLPLLDALKAMPVPQALLILLGAYLLLNFGQSLLQRNLTIRDTRIHTGFINYMRLETYRAMLQANWQFFIRKRKSDLITALTEELARVMNGDLPVSAVYGLTGVHADSGGNCLVAVRQAHLICAVLRHRHLLFLPSFYPEVKGGGKPDLRAGEKLHGRHNGSAERNQGY